MKDNKDLPLKSDNEIIAEFMGYVFKKDKTTPFEGYYVGEQYADDHSFPFGYCLHADELEHFASSWDWLMPVVQKIEKHCGAVVEMNICLAAHCRIFAINKQRSPIREFINGGSISLLESTYLSVVEFIKWYKSQKQ